MDALFRRWRPATKAQSPPPSSLDAREKGGDPHEWDHKYTLTSSKRSNQDDDHAHSSENEQPATAGTVGAEWVLIDEPSGFFFPQLTPQRQLLELDQAHHVLHYARYRRVMRLHAISLVTSVEEVAADGQRQWWMTIQDPHAPQVWVVHFCSRARLEAWIEMLRAVVQATGASAIVSDVVRASEFDRRRRSSACITIIRHVEAVGSWEPETTRAEEESGCRDVAIAVS